MGCECRPIPIPTLDEFVLLHKALQAAVQAQPEMLGLLQGARRSFGWNVLGISGPPLCHARSPSQGSSFTLKPAL